MRRLDAHTVELTDDETRAKQEFDEALADGFDIYAATVHVEQLFIDDNLDPAFYAWLKDEDDPTWVDEGGEGHGEDSHGEDSDAPAS